MSGAQLMMQGRQPAAGGSTFDPLTIPWHRAVWAEDPAWTPPADGGAVASWPDASGNARGYSQTDVTMQPLFRSSVAALNGRPAVHFDGSNDNLTAVFAAVNQPVGFFAVINLTKTATSTVFDAGGGGTTRGLQTTSASAWQLSFGTTVAAGLTATTGGHALFVLADGANSIARQDGVDGTVVNAGTGNANAPRLGARGSLAFEPLGGHVAFFGTTNRDFTATESADLLGWARSHYGTP